MKRDFPSTGVLGPEIDHLVEYEPIFGAGSGTVFCYALHSDTTDLDRVVESLGSGSISSGKKKSAHEMKPRS